MNYNIFINQKAIVESNIDLDIKDAAILDIMRGLAISNSIDKILVGNDVYFWMKSSMVIKENPILGIKSPDGLYRRLIKLSDMGLIKAHKDNQKMNRSYYCLTSLFSSIFISSDLRTEIGRSDDTYGRKSEGPTDENRKVPTDENRNDYINIYNNNNNDYNKEFFIKNSKQKPMFNFFVSEFAKIYEEAFKLKYTFEKKDWVHIYPLIDFIYEKYLEVANKKEATNSEVMESITLFLKGALILRSDYFLSNFDISNIRSQMKNIILKILEKQKDGKSINNTKQSREQQTATLNAYLSQFPDPRKQRV